MPDYKVKVALAAQLVASTTLLIAVTTPEGWSADTTDNYAYTIAASVLGAVFSLATLVLAQFAQALHDRKVFVAPVVGDVTVGFLIGLLILIWWAVAVGIITFQGPFTLACNGYFATWGGFVFAVQGFVAAAGFGSAEAKSAMSSANGPLIGLCAACIVVIFASAEHVGTEEVAGVSVDPAFLKQAAFALSWGVICFLILIAVFVLENVGSHKLTVKKFKLFILLFVALLWLVVACVTTFQGPFILTNNGYFCVWAGLVLSLQAAAASFKDDPSVLQKVSTTIVEHSRRTSNGEAETTSESSPAVQAAVDEKGREAPDVEQPTMPQMASAAPDVEQPTNPQMASAEAQPQHAEVHPNVPDGEQAQPQHAEMHPDAPDVEQPTNPQMAAAEAEQQQAEMHPNAPMS